MIRSVPNSWTSPDSVLKGARLGHVLADEEDARVAPHLLRDRLVDRLAVRHLAHGSAVEGVLHALGRRRRSTSRRIRIRRGERERARPRRPPSATPLVDALELGVVGVAAFVSRPAGAGSGRGSIIHSSSSCLRPVVVAVDVAHVVPVEAVGLALEERRTLAAHGRARPAVLAAPCTACTS